MLNFVMAKKDRVLKKFKPGGFFSGKQLQLTPTTLKYVGGFSGNFSVPRADVETVVVEQSGFTKSKLKIIGQGTTLAESKMYTSWAERAQSWILENAKV